MELEKNNLERSILAAVINEKDYLDLLKREGVQPEYFSDGFYAQIYRTMLELNKQGIVPDLIALIERFPDRQMNLIDISSCIGSGAEIESWVKLLKERFAERTLSNAYQKTLANPDIKNKIQTLDIALEQAKQLTSIRKETTLQAAVDSSFEAHAKGSSERVYWFDEHTEGRQKMIQFRGEMFIIAAESGRGKTELATNFVYQNLFIGKKGIYVCTESASSKIIERIAGQFAKISHKILSYDDSPKEQVDKLHDAMRCVAKDYEGSLMIYGSETGVNSADAIHAAAKEFVAKHGRLDFIVVDYIQNLQNPSHIQYTDQFNSLSYSVQKINETLAECHAAGVVLSQFNRPPKTGGNEMPDMNRLRGSSALENAPHAICMLCLNKDHQTKFFTAKVRNIDHVNIDLEWSGWTYISKVIDDPNINI